MLISVVSPVFALPNPPPQPSSLGLEATIPSTPPGSAPTIAVPASGQSFSSIPITIGGLCINGLLVKVFSNNVFVGSTICSGGSYSLKADLFSGNNTLYAQQYDSLGQGSPNSANVSVTYAGSQFTAPGALVVITSDYGELGANPGQTLSWPIILGGGTPPYALSTDWGDGTAPTLQSAAAAGQVTIQHVYTTPGVYTVTVSVSDNKGVTGFIQLVAIANGQITASTNKSVSKINSTTPVNTAIPLWALIIAAVALVVTFWLGSRHGRTVIKRNL